MNPLWEKKSEIGQLLLLSLLAYFFLFHGLDINPINLWDESRLAINSQEMFWDGDWIVTHYKGKPDMWNTKPPLMIWNQVLWTWILGMGEWALRLPSAFAALATCYLSYIFIKNQFDSRVSFLSIMVLLTSVGFLTLHGSRTGDYDAMLVLFTTLAAWKFYSFVQNGKNQDLWVFFIALGLGVLTKSISNLIFVPAYLIYAIWKKKLLFILRNPQFYLGLLGFLLLVSSYYLVREHLNPGYLEAVWENELGGRYSKALENHSEKWYYYLGRMVRLRYSPWIFILPITLIWSLYEFRKNKKDIYIYLIILEGFYFLVISMGQTKLSWYDLPLYPLMALNIGVFLNQIIKIYFTKLSPIAQTNKILYPLLIIILFAYPVYSIFQHIHNLESFFHNNPQNYASFKLQKGLRNQLDLDGYKVLEYGYTPQYEYYINAMKSKGVNIGYGWLANCKVGDKILISNTDSIHLLGQRFLLDTLQVDNKLYSFELLKTRDVQP